MVCSGGSSFLWTCASAMCHSLVCIQTCEKFICAPMCHSLVCIQTCEKFICAPMCHSLVCIQTCEKFICAPMCHSLVCIQTVRSSYVPQCATHWYAFRLWEVHMCPNVPLTGMHSDCEKFICAPMCHSLVCIQTVRSSYVPQCATHWYAFRLWEVHMCPSSPLESTPPTPTPPLSKSDVCVISHTLWILHCQQTNHFKEKMGRK